MGVIGLDLAVIVCAAGFSLASQPVPVFRADFHAVQGGDMEALAHGNPTKDQMPLMMPSLRAVSNWRCILRPGSSGFTSLFSRNPTRWARNSDRIRTIRHALLIPQTRLTPPASGFWAGFQPTAATSCRSTHLHQAASAWVHGIFPGDHLQILSIRWDQWRIAR